jgi:pimeloyl-ACP methyl ester carboxylesterase
MAASESYEDGWWQSPDGLKLHYRDYPGDPAKLPVLCLSGLTRNARDFAPVAARLSPGRRVICAELRGRGESANAPDPMSYTPPVYLADLAALIEALALERVVLFGTSLGGILSMLIGATMPGKVGGVLLNDIGPVVEAAGLARIRGYVGKNASWPTWVHAARTIAEGQRDAFPKYGLEDWLAMAKRLCRLTSAGKIVFAYDMRIAEPLRQPEVAAPPDMWPALDALAGRPALLVRGGRSDILSIATATEMARRLPEMEVVTLPDIGHAPVLDEPPAAAGIDRLLARIDAR